MEKNAIRIGVDLVPATTNFWFVNFELFSVLSFVLYYFFPHHRVFPLLFSTPSPIWNPVYLVPMRILALAALS